MYVPLPSKEMVVNHKKLVFKKCQHEEKMEKDIKKTHTPGLRRDKRAVERTVRMAISQRRRVPVF